jgi:hypothetical protein
VEEEEAINKVSRVWQNMKQRIEGRINATEREMNQEKRNRHIDIDVQTDVEK